jgi:hypothetical protein
MGNKSWMTTMEPLEREKYFDAPLISLDSTKCNASGPYSKEVSKTEIIGFLSPPFNPNINHTLTHGKEHK